MNKVLFLLVLLFTQQVVAATEDEAFEWYSTLSNLPSHKKSLTEIEMERLFRMARYHKVAALEKLSHYDPTGQIGFCFGRSMAVHLLARKMGLDSNSIRKLFIIGDLRQGAEPEWRFHVTTLVKDAQGEWWAIDPIMQPPLSWGGALKMADWMKTVQGTWDKKKKAHYYRVDNSTIFPDLRVVPEPEKEKGEKIIEISFDPIKHASQFPQTKIDDYAFSEINLATQMEYFINAFEASKEDRFQFLGMTINGETYDYRNYFVDLLSDLRRETREARDLQELEKGSFPIGLYSPRVDGWFR